MHILLAELEKIASSKPSLESSILTDSRIELLQNQIDFLETANSSISSSFTAISKSFDSFTGAINIFFAIALGIITVIGVIAAFLGIKSIGVLVEREVKRRVSQGVEDRIGSLEKLMRQQDILSRITVSYLVPDTTLAQTNEFLMLKQRIGNTLFKTEIDNQLKRSNVVVLDLVTSDLDKDEKGKEIAESIAKQLPRWSALILYTPTNHSPVFGHLDSLKKQGDQIVDYAAANMKITLMDRVIGASYASDALKS